MQPPPPMQQPAAATGAALSTSLRGVPSMAGSAGVAALRSARKAAGTSMHGHAEEALDSMKAVARAAAEDPLWAPIRAHAKWGEPQPLMHTSYLSLYFDLIMVAVAQKLNDLLVEGIQSNAIISHGLLAAALFASTEGLWDLKSGFDARFTYNDIFHRVFVLLVGSVFALSALAIGSYDEMASSEAPNALLFSGAVFTYYLCDFFAHVEMAVPFYKQQEPNITNSGRVHMAMHLVGGLTITGIAVACAATGQPLFITGIFWFIPPVVIRAILLVMIFSKSSYLSRKNGVPMHIKYSTHRWHEFFLLIAGEGIISIINEPVQNNADFYVTFFFSFFLLSTICMMHFSSAPHDPNQHALRRSSYRGILWIFLQKSIFFFLIPCASGFRLVLSNGADGNANHLGAVWLLSASTAIILVLIFASRVLHHGVYEEFIYLDRDELKVKVVLWVIRLALAFAILGAPYINAPSWGTLFYVWGLTALAFAFQMVDLQAFRDHHEEHIQKEVAERKVRYAKELHHGTESPPMDKMSPPPSLEPALPSSHSSFAVPLTAENEEETMDDKNARQTQELAQM